MILGEETDMLHLTSPSKHVNTVRPPHVNFRLPYEDLVIRPWEEEHRSACVQLITSVLEEYNIPFDSSAADRDVLCVEEAYRDGEFWVVEDINSSTIVGTAAFYPVPSRGPNAVELRKLYLRKQFRGRGLGSFLCSALEQRALEMGYTTAYVETISTMSQAVKMYKSTGYQDSSEIETARCDIVLEKQLDHIQPSAHEEFVQVVDSTACWTIAHILRKYAHKRRIPYRAVVVLVKNREHIFVHKRAMKKSTYPGRFSAFVTGAIANLEQPLEAARREVKEEIGLSNLKFSELFEPFFSRNSDNSSERILFHPFVAIGDFTEKDITLNLDEVESGQFMTREEIVEMKIGGSLWEQFSAHDL